MTSFLFLAPAPAPFGEAVCGIEIARAAHAAGHRVAFLHQSRLASLFAETPFSRGIIDDVIGTLPAAVREAVAARSIDVVILVDAVSTFGTLRAEGVRELARTCGAKVVALDLWSCHETNLVWDLGEIATPIDPIVTELPCLRPCPVARPEAPGAYRGLPELSPLAAEERARVRAELGIGDRERIVFTASGAWQSASRYPAGSAQRIAAAWPIALELITRRLGPVRVLHVGPDRFALGEGYHHLNQLPMTTFRRYLGASDLLLTNNTMATSIAAAIALDIPTLVVRNSAAGATADEVAEQAGHALDRDVRSWVEAVLPLRPFTVSPLGLRDFLAPVLAGNPYCDAIEHAEVLAADATAARARALLDGDPEVAMRRAAYRARVAQLPTGLESLVALTA